MTNLQEPVSKTTWKETSRKAAGKKAIGKEEHEHDDCHLAIPLHFSFKPFSDS